MKPSQSKTSLVALCLGALILAPLSAQAGGLYVSEFGTPDMGTAGAGAIARGRDASAALHNPAAMTRLESHQAMLGAAPGISVIKFDTDSRSPTKGNEGGNQGGFIPLLSASYVHRISERLRAGLGVISLSGAVLDANDTWSGRNEVTELSLLTLSFYPSVGVKLTDEFSLGAGAFVTYGRLDWKLKAATPMGEGTVHMDDLDDWAAAPVVSAHWEPTSNLRLGLVYQGELELKLDGDIKFPPGASPNSRLELPLAQAIRGDFFWEIDDTWALMGGFAWEDWSSADTVPLSIGTMGANVKLGMKDTWKLRLGAHYRLREAWVLQTGLSYDSSALDTSHRIAGLPLDQQWRVGVGAIHDYSDTTQLGFAFEYVNLGRGRLNTANVRGDYERNEIFFFMFSVNWKKLPWDGLASIN